MLHIGTWASETSRSAPKKAQKDVLSLSLSAESGLQFGQRLLQQILESLNSPPFAETC